MLATLKTDYALQLAQALDAIRQTMQAHGITPPEEVFADGVIHRFSSGGKRGDDAGWYVVYPDGVPAWAFGCWRSGVSVTGAAKSEGEMTQAEREAHRRRMEQAKAQREAEQALRRAEARASAAARFSAAQMALVHPYTVQKGVGLYGVKVEGDSLLVPMRDADGALHSLQVIDADGEKRFLTGGRVKGCFHLVGSIHDTVLVTEGYATGASLHEASGYPVAVAFNAGNLQAVAQVLRDRHQQARIVICADDDYLTAGNPGITEGKSAAQSVGGFLAVPEFGLDRPEKATDFNDLHQHKGLDAVAGCVAAALPPTAIWPDPLPLPTALPPVQKLDMELVPRALRGLVKDVSDRMQCPIDFIAVALMVCLSSLVGARAVIRPKRHDDWQVTGVLWGLIVGRPGVMKSPALSVILTFLNRLQAEAHERWAVAHEEWKADAEIAEMVAEANQKEAKKHAAKDPQKARALLQRQELNPEPVARRYIVNDSTVEKLGELCAENPWGFAVYRDEMHSLLCEMDRQGQEGARGFYLTAFDGNQGYTFDRIGRGTTYIPRVCLAMLGGIQPGKLQSYVREAVNGGSGDDGLLQRFQLLVWPDIDPGFTDVDRWPDSEAKRAARDVFERLDALAPAAEDQAQEWRFSDEAQALFTEWRTPFEMEVRGDELHPALISHLSKYRKLIPSLALLFALIDTPDSGHTVGVEELTRALAWGDYLRSHAERVYAAATTPEAEGAHQLLRKIKSGKLTDSDGVLMESFALRDVASKGWSGLTTSEGVRKAAEIAADYGWLVRQEVRTGPAGGRPSEKYLIHPVLLKGGAA